MIGEGFSRWQIIKLKRHSLCIAKRLLRGLRSYEHTGPAMEQLSKPKASFAQSQVINRVRGAHSIDTLFPDVISCYNEKVHMCIQACRKGKGSIYRIREIIL